jgi:serine/threonine protein kinase|tara:strand:+ start:926 stop:1045 length:120 start_codon:yes stop_codon:yes gene_type:complete
VKDLISKLLVADPSKRLTAGGALSHPWMKMMKEANDVKD